MDNSLSLIDVPNIRLAGYLIWPDIRIGPKTDIFDIRFLFLLCFDNFDEEKYLYSSTNSIFSMKKHTHLLVFYICHLFRQYGAKTATIQQV